MALVALLVLGLALVACGSDDDLDGTGTSSTTTRATTTADDGSTTVTGGGTTTSEPDDGPSLDDVTVAVTEVARLNFPTALAPRPGTDTLYVTERAGFVKALTVEGDGTGSVAEEPVLDISDDTTTDGERGLLGLTFSEDGSELFINHTNADGNTRVAGYAMDGDIADPGSRRELLAVEQPFANHNGGDIVLGPDGWLWVGLGDGGAGDDPGNRAQDPDDPLGKMLRIDPDAPESPELYALGLRNPWRYSFDRKTDDLWIGDVGQDAIEEIDFLPAGTEAGTNFGWSGYEGTARNIEDRIPADAVPPVFEVTHDDGWCSITGGVVYRGTAIEDLAGAYLFGDFCKPELHALVLVDGTVDQERTLGPEISQLVSIDEDADGEVYLLSLDGTVSRLDPG